MPVHREDGGITLSFKNDQLIVRTFLGRLVKGKSPEETALIAERIIKAMNVDVLAVQEVEHIEILKEFNKKYLNSYYRYYALVEGNDNRLIDVGVLSTYPIGPIVSHQTAIHPDKPEERVFSRDLLQVEIQDFDRNKLFTFYNTHLKSHYVPFSEDQEAGTEKANNRRRQQAEAISSILNRNESADSRFLLVGDMNDPPESEYLLPMRDFHGTILVNAVIDPEETREPKAELPGQGPGPSTKAWTHRFNPSGPELPRYELYDQIWVSPALENAIAFAKIDRRTKHSGDGSDHDPVWIGIDF
jgi:endonuclease/exonuclease/phosphatase family metal-dependent hydrolase